MFTKKRSRHGIEDQRGKVKERKRSEVDRDEDVTADMRTFGGSNEVILQSECPLCGEPTASSLLQSHVNLCLDRSETNMHFTNGEKKRRTVATSENDARQPHSDLPVPEVKGPKASCDQPLVDLLGRLKLDDIAPQLLRNGYTSLSSLRLVTNDELVRIGVGGIGVRKRILIELSAMFTERKQLGISDSIAVVALPAPRSGKGVPGECSHLQHVLLLHCMSLMFPSARSQGDNSFR